MHSRPYFMLKTMAPQNWANLWCQALLQEELDEIDARTGLWFLVFL